MPPSGIAALLAAGAVMLAGCGGESDEDEIRAVIQDVARDAATICEHSTEKLLETVGGSEEECRRQAEADPDRSAEEIRDEIDVRIDGDRATARFTDNEDVEQTVTFVKRGGDWLVDAVGRAAAGTSPG